MIRSRPFVFVNLRSSAVGLSPSCAFAVFFALFVPFRGYFRSYLTALGFDPGLRFARQPEPSLPSFPSVKITFPSIKSPWLPTRPPRAFLCEGARP
jgi:hypothetical protein